MFEPWAALNHLADETEIEDVVHRTDTIAARVGVVDRRIGIQAIVG
jgi:hypothetical protein